jgi:hypothetical protein
VQTFAAVFFFPFVLFRLEASAVTNVLVPIVAATTWISGFQYYRSNPLKELPSREGISKGAEKLGEAVNTALVTVGFGLFMVCLLPYIQGDKKDKKD